MAQQHRKEAQRQQQQQPMAITTQPTLPNHPTVPGTCGAKTLKPSNNHARAHAPGRRYKIVQLKLRWAKHAQVCSAAFQEVLPAIKLVKYYGYERYFEDRINQVGACMGACVCVSGGGGVATGRSITCRTMQNSLYV